MRKKGQLCKGSSSRKKYVKCAEFKENIQRDQLVLRFVKKKEKFELIIFIILYIFLYIHFL